MKKQQIINHVALVLDDSGSMGHLRLKAIEIINKQVAELKRQSKATRQETRLSIWTFGTYVKNIVFDVALETVPDATEYYSANQGNTALIDGTWEAVSDMQDISPKHGDHAYLIYVITDGLENASKHSANQLTNLLKNLDDEFTLAVLVPNATAMHNAKQYGFPAGNISIWEVTESGLEDMGKVMCAATTSYYSTRALGDKGTKKLFELPSITKTEVKRKLEEVDPADYETLLVRKYYDGTAIKDFVESWTKRPYRVGSAYYQLSKPEKIQAGKVVAVLEKSTGKVFSGVQARKLLGLPNYEVKAAPADYPSFDVFIQSTSTNRKLVADTSLIVFK